MNEDSISLNSSIGMTYILAQQFSMGLFFNISHRNMNLKVTCLILNFNVYGYGIKFPFFCGTKTDSPEGCSVLSSGLGLTLGLAAASNLVAYFAFQRYSKSKKGKKYTSLDVDFRKFQEKFITFKEKEQVIIRTLDFINLGG